MVGLGRIELPTSPLSGVRSSQLSYRPMFKRLCRTTRGNAAELRRCVGHRGQSSLNPQVIRRDESLKAGGAGRDRTGDLLSANQALSQLSYSPW